MSTMLIEDEKFVRIYHSLCLMGSEVCGLALIAGGLIDGFNTIVVPRRVRHIFGGSHVFWRLTWASYPAIGRRIESGARREEFLSAGVLGTGTH